MKKYSILIIFIMVFSLIGCVEDTEPIEKEIELLNDNFFRNGFTVGAADNEPQPDNRYPLEYHFRYGNPEGQIMWMVEQHGCRFGLADDYALGGKSIAYDNGFYTIESYSKKIIVNPDIGSLTFEVNASKEFLAPRQSKEAWPHLIMAQGLKEQIVLKDAESIVLTMDVTLNKSERKMTAEEYNPSLHTAQYLMYIVVRSNAALDAGEFLWFGIPIYDARYKFMPESGMVDAGTAGNTGKFIYQMPQNEFMPNGLPLNEKVQINVDLVQYFERALNMAHQHNLMVNTTVQDLYLTNMNIGFEIPGTYDISVTLENFSLKARLK